MSFCFNCSLGIDTVFLMSCLFSLFWVSDSIWTVGLIDFLERRDLWKLCVGLTNGFL